MSKVLALGNISDKEALETLGLDCQNSEVVRNDKQVADQLAQWLIGSCRIAVPEPVFCMLVREKALEVLVYGNFSDEQVQRLLEVSEKSPSVIRSAAKARERLTKWLIQSEENILAPVVCTEMAE